MRPYRIVVLGGYGFFGRRLVERLARQAGLEVLVCGRSEREARALVQSLRGEAHAVLRAAVLDVSAPSFSQDLAALQPEVTVHTVGPFQGQSYQVARHCLDCGSHYIDLADGRQFVQGIDVLDAAARSAGLVVVSGASSVPALSSAAVDSVAPSFRRVDRIDIGISPGNRTERGLSTVQAILSYCGKPMPPDGRAPVYGWSGRYRYTYPEPVGRRWLSPCDVPDLSLLPNRYVGTPRVRFGAGLELPFLHFGMNVMARLVRWGLVSDWSVHAVWLKRIADGFKRWGSDAGAMHVAVAGESEAGNSKVATWQLVATQGDGPYVPTLAAAALVRKLHCGRLAWVGAAPCIGLLTLDDFVRECEGLHITMERTEP